MLPACGPAQVRHVAAVPVQGSKRRRHGKKVSLTHNNAVSSTSTAHLPNKPAPAPPSLACLKEWAWANQTRVQTKEHQTPRGRQVGWGGGVSPGSVQTTHHKWGREGTRGRLQPGGRVGVGREGKLGNHNKQTNTTMPHKRTCSCREGE